MVLGREIQEIWWPPNGRIGQRWRVPSQDGSGLRELQKDGDYIVITMRKTSIRNKMRCVTSLSRRVHIWHNLPQLTLALTIALVLTRTVALANNSVDTYGLIDWVAVSACSEICPRRRRAADL